jgi:RNA polymerase sigma-70 factor (ECF subfamily)
MGNSAVAVRRRRQACSERLLKAFDSARPDLVQTLARMLGNNDDAQDASQEAFLKCWRSRDQVGDVENLRAWIFRVGLNAARDLQRNVWRHRAKPLTQPCALPDRPRPSPSEEVLHKETLDRLRFALADLRKEERDIFLMRQNSDLTYEEIGSVRRTPVGTVKTRMRAALQKLREVLQEKDCLAQT